MTDQASNTVESEKTVNLEKKPAKAGKYLFIGSLILACGGMALGYSIGHKQGLTVVGYDADAAELVEVVKKQKETAVELNKALNLAIQERDIAVGNVTQVSHTLTETKADLSIAQTQSQLYKDVLKQRGGVGLMVQNLGVRPLPENAFEYQVDLMQVSPTQRRATGHVELRLIRGDDVLVVPMESKDFSFDNFQRLTGRWTMPKGFVPHFIEVRLSGGVSEVKRFSWLRGQQVPSPAPFVADIPQAQSKIQ